MMSEEATTAEDTLETILEDYESDEDILKDIYPDEYGDTDRSADQIDVLCDLKAKEDIDRETHRVANQMNVNIEEVPSDRRTGLVESGN